MEGLQVRKNDAGKIFDELPWLRGIVGEVDHGDRPVYLVFPPEIPSLLTLAYGRRNDDQDTSYTRGYTHVYYIRGSEVSEQTLWEGTTTLPASSLECDFVVLRFRYRSELVENYPGFMRYDVFRSESVERAKDEKSRREADLAQKAMAALAA